MIRWIMYLLGHTDYEDCKSCQTLKEQLEVTRQLVEFEVQKNRELTQSVLDLIKPKPAPELAEPNLQPIRTAARPFSIRRQVMEERDRIAAQITRESPRLAKPDNELRNPNAGQSVEALERELGIDEEGAPE